MTMNVIRLDQVAELLMGVPAPVVYWEQGHEWVFGDPIRFQVCVTFGFTFACTMRSVGTHDEVWHTTWCQHVHSLTERLLTPMKS